VNSRTWINHEPVRCSAQPRRQLEHPCQVRSLSNGWRGTAALSQFSTLARNGICIEFEARRMADSAGGFQEMASALHPQMDNISVFTSMLLLAALGNQLGLAQLVFAANNNQTAFKPILSFSFQISKTMCFLLKNIQPFYKIMFPKRSAFNLNLEWMISTHFFSIC